jgi:CxxC-x17-CxxC domain-containing protein
VETQFVDKTLVCLECQLEFAYPAEMQRLHAERGYTGEPRRCTRCRRLRNPSGRQQRPRRNASEAGAAQASFPAECSSCGKATTVPFKPAAGRPVYCRECFRSRRAGAE